MIQTNLQRVIVGSVLVIATTALIPIARQTLRPMVKDLSKQMKFFLVSAKEGIEDMAAEVKFERMKKQLDQDVLIDCDVEIEEQTGRIFH